jgi:Zn-dependent protease with chaperone function
VADSFAGKKGKCPKCREVLLVPTKAADGALASHSIQPTQLAAVRSADSGADAREVIPITAVNGEGVKAVLPSKRLPLIGLPASAFQHPLDRKATSALKALKGFDWFVRKFIEYGVERFMRAENLGSNVRVGPRQLSKMYSMLREACDVLDVPEPELYLGQGGVNAETSGNDHPYIVVFTGLLEVTNEDELMAVIAHELGHIKCGHVLYRVMARAMGSQIGPFCRGALTELASGLTLGIGGAVIDTLESAIERALLVWSQRSELSADRAALLVMQDSRPCVSMLMKLAGGSRRWADQMDPEQFLNQARAYQEGLDRSTLDRFYRYMAHHDLDHPVAVERARELDEWIDSVEYNDILAGRYPKTSAPSAGDVCPTCEAQNEAGDRFCVLCGTPLRTH